MIIEPQGMLYRVALDVEAVHKISYSLIVMAEDSLAKELLVKTFCTPEQADTIVAEIIEQLQEESKKE